MDTTENSVIEPASESQERPQRPRRVIVALLGALLAVAAWVVLFWSGELSFFIALASLVVSIFALKSSHRNLAITAIIASSVLMLVFAIFEGTIYFLLRSL